MFAFALGFLFFFFLFSNVGLSYWIFILSCGFAMWCGMEDRRGCWVVGEVVLGILTLFREVGWGVLGMGCAEWKRSEVVGMILPGGLRRL